MSTGTNDIFEALLDRLFDYAGMFPPAAKSFESALRESADLPRTLRRPFMLNADIVLDTAHAQRLCDLEIRSFGFTRELSVSLLATSEVGHVLTVADKLRGVRSAIDDVRCRVSSIELKHDAGKVDEALLTLSEYCGKHQILLAIEPDLSTPQWKDTLAQTLESLATLTVPSALKCRGSGPTGIGPEKLAHALCRVSDAGLPFKVTGGLHHPIVESVRYGNTMGFLNLTVAVMLRRIHGSALGEAEVAALLVNSDPAVFTWGAALKYGGLSLSSRELASAKAKTPFSIGSCSLVEPDEDLARLFS